jgi:hypothetical protein
LIFRMDTCSWATKSPPRSVEELPSPVVQRRRPDETFFRKSFRHVNNVFRSGLFFYSLPAGILIHIPGVFIQNLSERPIHIARNPHLSRPCGCLAFGSGAITVAKSASYQLMPKKSRRWRLLTPKCLVSELLLCGQQSGD